jgi:peptidyl-prolyl cis-trans isomerase C
MFLTRSAALAAVFAAGMATSVQAQSADTVVATVDGTEITLGHMAVLYERLPEQYRQMPPSALYDGILEQLIQQAAVGAQLETLSTRGTLTLENEERALRASEVIREAAEGAVSDEAVQAVYDEMFGNAEAETEFNANHILVETEEEAAALKQEIEGGADFEALAQEHSTGPSGPSGGALGWFGMGMMVPPFEEAVAGMEPGEVSGPVQTQFGWHLIKLNETRDKEAPSLDEVRGQLEEQVRQDAIEAMVEQAVGDAVVERSEDQIDPALLQDQSLLAE